MSAVEREHSMGSMNKQENGHVRLTAVNVSDQVKYRPAYDQFYCGRKAKVCQYLRPTNKPAGIVQTRAVHE